MNETLSLLLRLNLAAAGAVVLALLLRRPTRRLFGARVAYGLWWLVPLAAAAMLAPARVVTVSVAPSPLASPLVSAAGGGLVPALHAEAAPQVASIVFALWIAGMLAAGAHLAVRQARFSRAAQAGRAGPAVVGVLRPRIVTPDDFAQRYTPREQRVILAHEATHIARQDPRINAVVATARCIAWFNPLVHVLARCLRIDQELACDAQVVAAHPAARRCYAEAMLKTQLAAQPLPLGCYWPASSTHPLAERIRLLSRRSPGRTERALGGAIVGLLALAAAWAAWASRPVEVVIAPTSGARIAAAAPALAAPVAPAAARTPDAPARPTASRGRAAAEAKVARLPSDDGLPLTPAPPPPADGSAGTLALRPPGFFGPPRIRAAASWSAVDPGSAVRVVATMTDPDGIPLVTDLTAFGSQSRYRIGYVERNASRYRLFTRVVQRGDRLLVTAALNRSFQPMVSGSVELASGETGTVRLPNGQLVTVTPTLRPESPEEIAEGRRTGGRAFVKLDRVDQL